MAVIVWCNSCNTVIWAYDHQKPCDLRGILNSLKMPCRLCKDEGNFDGWESEEAYPVVKEVYPEANIYDDWSAMRYIAKSHKLYWNPSGDCRWFPKGTEITLPNNEEEEEC